MNDLMLHRAAQLSEAEFGPQWRTVADMLGTEGCETCRKGTDFFHGIPRTGRRR